MITNIKFNNLTDIPKRNTKNSLTTFTSNKKQSTFNDVPMKGTGFITKTKEFLFDCKKKVLEFSKKLISNLVISLMVFPKINRAPMLSIKDKIDNVYFKSGDGTLLNAWYIKPQNNKPTILYLHGGNKNISSRSSQKMAEYFSQKGYGMFMLDYRGYGHSKGAFSEQGFYDDAKAAAKYLEKEKKISANNMIVWGFCMGGSIASNLASQKDFKSVVILSSADKPPSIFNYMGRYSILKPLTSFINRFDLKMFNTINYVSKIKSPLLIMMSENDPIVPSSALKEYKKSNPSAVTDVFYDKGHEETLWSKERALKFFEG